MEIESLESITMNEKISFSMFSKDLGILDENQLNLLRDQIMEINEFEVIIKELEISMELLNYFEYNSSTRWVLDLYKSILESDVKMNDSFNESELCKSLKEFKINSKNTIISLEISLIYKSKNYHEILTFFNNNHKLFDDEYLVIFLIKGLINILCSNLKVENTFENFYSDKLTSLLSKNEMFLMNCKKNTVYEQTILFYNTLMEKNYSNPFTNFTLGYLCKLMNKNQEARRLFCKSLNSFPYFWECWIEYFSLIKEKKSFDFQFAEIENHWVKHFYLANGLQEIGYYNDSASIYVFLNEKFKKNVQITASIGYSLYKLNYLDLAGKKIKSILYDYPDRLDYIDIYCMICLESKVIKPIIDMSCTIYSKNKLLPEANFVIFSYYFQLKEYKIAIKYMERILRLNPNNLVYRIYLGKCYEKMSNSTVAFGIYNSTIKEDKYFFEGYYNLGRLYNLEKLYKYSNYYLNEALNLNTSKHIEIEIYHKLAYNYTKLEEYNNASKCYERLSNLTEPTILVLIDHADILWLADYRQKNKSYLMYEKVFNEFDKNSDFFNQLKMLKQDSLSNMLKRLSIYYSEVKNEEKYLLVEKYLSII